MTAQLDAAGGVRAGEELDATALSRWLASAAPEYAGGSIVVEQFPRGFSNLTYLLRFSGDRQLVLRRPPRGVRKGSAHDMTREFRILRALHARGGRVPHPVAACEDESVLGAPFYVMERVRGLILRQAAPPGLDLTPAIMRGLSMSLIDAMRAIHDTPLDAEGIKELGSPAGYVQRQVQGWAKRYGAARTDEIAEMEQLAAWLDANRPGEWGAALIHNDFKYDNMVLEPDNVTRVLAVLDWEMATLGDPLLDLGTTLGYWVDADDPPALRSLGLGITALPGSLTRAELWAEYERRAGRPLGDPVFYFAFGLFKLGVISQQIYARYKAGLTADERFGALIHAVRALSQTGMRAVALKRLDRLAAG